MVPTPDQSKIDKALRAFLLGIMPAGFEAVAGQDNRVAEPKVADFAVTWPLRRTRLSTNVSTAMDAKFTGSIAGAVMTVSAVALGSIAAGRPVVGVGVAAGTAVVEQLTGPAGGAGTYKVAPSQSLSSRTLSAGGRSVRQGTMVTMQVEVHGPASADNAEVITTLMRDPYAVEAFAAIDPDIVPLHADDPKQLPFLNDQQQYENRWVVEALLQANQSVVVPQQYADAVAVDVVSVDAAFPPS